MGAECLAHIAEQLYTPALGAVCRSRAEAELKHQEASILRPSPTVVGSPTELGFFAKDTNWDQQKAPSPTQKGGESSLSLSWNKPESGAELVLVVGHQGSDGSEGAEY